MRERERESQRERERERERVRESEREREGKRVSDGRMRFTMVVAVSGMVSTAVVISSPGVSSWS